MSKVKTEEKIIVALDVGNFRHAEALVRDLEGIISFFKVGLELFTSSGPDVASMITDSGARLFLDLKFFDIPNTVKGAVKSVSSLGVSIINVHAMGGRRMMRAAAEAAAESANPPKVIAVTVLTSFEEEDFREVGFTGSIEDSVVDLATQAKSAGLDGVVCSPNEIRSIRDRFGEDFLIVTPGVRPSWSSTNDQRRVMTPKEALNAGADFIVVGRPITGNEDPGRAAKRIIEEIDG